MKTGRFGAGIWACAVVIALAATLPFVETNARYVLDPDLRVDDISLYYQVLASWDFGLLTAPEPNVYFQGHSLIYALIAHLIAPFAPALSLHDLAITATEVTDGLAHVFATLVFFATARRLTGEWLAALLLTALFAASPQILAIDMIRIDRLILLPLMVVLYESVLVARGEAGPRDGIWLGLALAIVATTKITGAMFAVFPFTAAAALLIADRKTWPQVRRVTVITLAAGIPVFALLMFRFLMHAGGFVDYLKTGTAMQAKWTAVLPFTPLFYYNVDLFAGYGLWFLALVAIAVVIVAIRALRRDATSLWLLVNLLLFSALGMALFKYERGGYHLVPLYLFVLAVAFRHLRETVPNTRLAFGAGLVALAVPVVTVGFAYANAAEVVAARRHSIDLTRIAARDWIVAQFAPGSRICMMSNTQWANPQLVGLGFHVTTMPFDFPYLDAKAMGDYVPPRLYQVRAACDAVVFNDAHIAAYMANFHSQGHAARAREWEALFAALRAAYPPKVFAADTPAYAVSRVEVYDLRTATTPEWGAQPAHETVLTGTLVGDALQIGDRRMPIVPERLHGFVGSILRAGHNVTVDGWAVDTMTSQPALGIVVVAGDRIVAFDGTGTVRRPDVAAAYTKPDLVLAGFATCLQPAATDRLRVFALAVEGVASEFPVPDPTELPPDARLAACISAEEG